MKLLGMVVFLITIIAFILSLNYSGKSKTIYPELITDNRMPAPQSYSNGGFHNNSFPITLISKIPKSKIYYTLDGSKPTLQSTVYNAPITIVN
ncbi:MAG: chitobiase/beta-hexosaminidase C-terminal domain-containing protein, partial [Bacteroidetes bacterium]|nr:chitobiase/beta-hexosaminidase C-terminal domain-containing protein [Bacteroidota bacterium]